MIALSQFKEIKLNQTRTTFGDGSEYLTPDLAISEKIQEYSLRLGQSPPYTLSIFVQLLIEGKVRLEFRDFSERLELVDKKTMMTRNEAVALTEKFLASISKENTSGSGLDVTQKLIIQAPRQARRQP